MSAFRVGQKVVCIDATWVGIGPLEPNRVYTIAGFETVGVRQDRSYIGKYKGGNLVVLAEVKNPDYEFLGFSCERFRPVHTLESDMEIFKAIPIPTEVEA